MNPENLKRAVTDQKMQMKALLEREKLVKRDGKEKAEKALKYP